VKAFRLPGGPETPVAKLDRRSRALKFFHSSGETKETGATNAKLSSSPNLDNRAKSKILWYAWRTLNAPAPDPGGQLKTETPIKLGGNT